MAEIALRTGRAAPDLEGALQGSCWALSGPEVPWSEPLGVSQTRPPGGGRARPGRGPGGLVVAVGLWIYLSLGVPFPANAESHFDQLGRRAYAIWDCAAYALLLEDKQDQAEVLFKSGYELHKEMVEGLRNGDITDENSSNWPVAYRWYLVGGPTVDFIVGYMWAQFSQYAYDETWDSDLQASFDDKKQLQITKALTGFQNKNCELLLQ